MIKAKRADVAKKAGVSVATVSNVLNGTKKVSLEVEQRVREASMDLKYMPNRNAQALAGGRSNTIMLLTEDISNIYQLEVIKSMQVEALHHDYFLYMCDTRGDLNKYLRHIISRPPDGVFALTAPNSLTDEHLIQLRSAGIHLLADYARNTFLPDVSYIMSDMYQGFTEAVGKLKELGHREIGFLSAFDETCYYDSRLSAFKTAMRNLLGNNMPTIEYGSSILYQTTEENGNKLMRNMIQNHPEVTAVLCTNDLMAIGAIKAAIKMGKRVPEDISVIGLDSISAGMEITPTLTTISQDAHEYGKQAFKVLHRDIVDNVTGKYILPMKLIVRESIGPVKK